MVFAQVAVRLTPLLGCLFVANFGAEMSDVIRLFSVYNAATTPVLLPIIVPYLETGRYILTVPDFLAVCAAIFAGGTATYIAATNRGFGIKVQGLAWGFVVSGITTPLYIGQLKEYSASQGMDIRPVMAWVILASSGLQGLIIADLTRRAEATVNIVFSAIIGVYAGILTVASLGYEFTEGLSAESMMSGESGCTRWSCYLTLGIAAGVALICLYNQTLIYKLRKNPDKNDGATGYAGVFYTFWSKISIFADPVFMLDRALKVIGDDDKDASAKASAIADVVDSTTKTFTFISLVMVLTGCAALLVSTIELFAHGIYTRTSSMTMLGCMVLASCAFVLVTSWVGARALKISKGSPAKNKWTKMFLLFGFVCAPTLGCVSLVCLELGGEENAKVPWVTDFLGTTVGFTRADIISQVASNNSSNSSSNSTQSESELESLYKLGCSKVGAQCDDIDRQTAVDRVLKEMPTVGLLLALMAVGLLVVIALECRAMGGWRYLAVQISGFTALLNFIYGVGVAVGTLILHDIESAEERLMQLDTNSATTYSLFNFLGYVSIVMVVGSLIGMIGLKAGGGAASVALRVYLVALIITGVLFGGCFLLAYHLSKNAENLVDQYWNHTDFQAQKNETIFRDLKKDEFVGIVEANFDIFMTFATVSLAYTGLAVVSTHMACGGKATKFSGVNGLEEGLSPKKGKMMKNPMMEESLEDHGLEAPS